MFAILLCLFSLLCIAAVVVLVASISGLFIGISGLRRQNAYERRPVSYKIRSWLIIVCSSIVLAPFVYWIASFYSLDIIKNQTTPQLYDPADPEVFPFITAINGVDRAALGFTQIAPHTRISIGSVKSPPAEYDILMHVYGETSRTIAFKRIDNEFFWIGEQEIHYGPNTYQSGDGQSRASITVTYETVPVSGAPLRQLTIFYNGLDPRLAFRQDLSLEDVLPILSEWQQLEPSPTPQL